MYIPSAKVAIIALCCAIGVGGLLYYTYKEQKKHASITASALATYVQSSAQAIAELDTDNDGLKNWEESLWGTNPEKKDSDGDGTPDGAEALANRDPSKGGSDALPKNGPLETPDYFKTATSTTDAAAKQLFADYLALKQSGKLTPVTTNALVADLVKKIESHKKTPTTYTTADISIVPESKENYLAYESAVFAIMGEFTPETNEGRVLAAAMQRKFEGIEGLMPYIEKNRKAIDAMTELRVPSGVSKAHLDFLNAFSAYNNSLESIQHIKIDPIMALTEGSLIIVHDQAMIDSMAEIGKYFTKWKS